MAEAQGCTVHELQNVNFKRRLRALPAAKLCDGCKTKVPHGLGPERDGQRNDYFWSSGKVEEDCTCEGDDLDCKFCKGTGATSAKCPDCDGEGYVEVTA